MAGVTDSRQMNALLTLTLEHIIDGWEEQIFDDYPLMSYLNGRLGRKLRGETVKKMVQGGERIRAQVMYAMNSTVKSYSGAELLDTTLQDGMTTAFFSWKQYAGTIGITGLEEISNSGKEAIGNLLEAKKEQTIMTLKDTMSVDAWSDGTGNSSKTLTGLQAILSTSTTLGGLNPSTYSWWQASINNTSINFDSSSAGINAMRTKLNDLTYGQDRPDCIMTTQTFYEEYEKELTANKRYTSNEVADAGFRSLDFNGVPVMFDRDCPSSWMVFLNSKWLKYCVHRDRDFKMTPFIENQQQDARSAKLLFAGNMITTQRRKLGALTNLS